MKRLKETRERLSKRTQILLFYGSFIVVCFFIWLRITETQEVVLSPFDSTHKLFQQSIPFVDIRVISSASVALEAAVVFESQQGFSVLPAPDVTTINIKNLLNLSCQDLDLQLGSFLSPNGDAVSLFLFGQEEVLAAGNNDAEGCLSQTSLLHVGKHTACAVIGTKSAKIAKGHLERVKEALLSGMDTQANMFLTTDSVRISLIVEEGADTDAGAHGLSHKLWQAVQRNFIPLSESISSSLFGNTLARPTPILEVLGDAPALPITTASNDGDGRAIPSHLIPEWTAGVERLLTAGSSHLPHVVCVLPSQPTSFAFEDQSTSTSSTVMLRHQQTIVHVMPTELTEESLAQCVTTWGVADVSAAGEWALPQTRLGARMLARDIVSNDRRSLLRDLEALHSAVDEEGVRVSARVADAVAQCSVHMDKASGVLARGDVPSAAHHVREAARLARSALADPSLMMPPHFPSEHKAALYLPIVLPIMTTVVIGSIKELKRTRAKKNS